MKNNNKIIQSVVIKSFVFGSIQLILVKRVEEEEAIHARARYFIHVFSVVVATTRCCLDFPILRNICAHCEC